MDLLRPGDVMADVLVAKKVAGSMKELAKALR
jgi:hypothetical protein